MPDHSTLIKHTQKWLLTVIIEHRFCPFAKPEYDNNSIHYEVIETVNLQSQLEQILGHCSALDKYGDRETSLLIFPSGLSDFEDYLDMLDIANALLKAEGYEGIYQLASFHPQYRFADENSNNPSHYTNRSPYPMVHILRESSIEAALKNYPNPEKIPEQNIALTHSLGLKAMQALLAACYT